MTRRAREKASDANRRADQIGEHASRASALLASRAQERKAGQGFSSPSAARPSAQGRRPAAASPGRREQSGRQEQPGRPAQSGQQPQSGKSGPQGARQAYPKNLAQYLRQNIGYIISVIAVVLITVGLMFAVHFVLQATSNDEAAEEEAGYVAPYDWTKLDRSNGRYRYVVDGQVRSRVGVDVSDHQHVIDWPSVAADGVDFAMVRVGYRGATEGDLYQDERFQENLQGARAAGLDCGAYFFSQAKTIAEAKEEAEFVLEQLNGVSLEYPVAFDSEATVTGVAATRTAGLSGNAMVDIAEAFCGRLEEAGYRTIVYGSARDLARYNYEKLKQHDIWWAQYDTPQPTADIDFIMWQYTSSGQVAGIDGDADLNIDLSGALG